MHLFERVVAPVGARLRVTSCAVNFHIEPYENRNASSVARDARLLVETFGEHPAFHRMQVDDGRSLPVYYVYDSYHTPMEEWAMLLKRGTAARPRDCRPLAN